MASCVLSGSRLSSGVALLLLWLSVDIAAGWAQSFQDITAEAGIEFVATDGGDGRHRFPEFLGRGVALFDYDADGDLDIYLPNGARLEDSEAADRSNTLYRNDGNARFTDVTAAAGVGHTGYGLGCAVGDVDNDGWPDLYVTNLGSNVLYRNLGGGVFEDITDRAGVAATGLNTSCAFADLDGDGLLDIYVTRYADYSVATDVPCVRDGISVYCHPHVYEGATDVILRNTGDALFVDASEVSGIASLPPSHGLGVAIGDVDGDGDVDIYVANDLDPNFLLLNQGDGTFVDGGLFAGVATSELGVAEAGMGVAMADVDNDGDLDIAVTNFQYETYSLYRNDGDAMFTDVTAVSRVAEATYAPLGWGVGLEDFDNDGWRDLFFANGHTQDHIATFEPGMGYAQRDLLLRNVGDGTYANLPDWRGALTGGPRPSRGAAFGDLDGDGRLDIVVTTRNGLPMLLRNVSDNDGAWTSLTLRGRQGGATAVGAKVEVVTGDRRRYGHVVGGGSFLSQSDRALHIGLGDAIAINAVHVTWLSGLTETFTDVPIRRPVSLTQGRGTPRTRVD